MTDAGYPAPMRVAVEPVLLACCAVEVATALHAPAPLPGIDWVLDDGPRDVTVVVLAGTITHASESRIRQVIAAAPEPRATIAFGVCASSGGPYWDSDAVMQGWPAADLFVPGCPPPPPVLWTSVARTAQEVASRAAH